LSEGARRSLWREPALWGFLIGAAMLTAVVPLLRRVPDPPPVVGHVPASWAWRLEDAGGRAFGPRDLAGRVAVIGLLGRDGDSASVLGRAMRTLDERYERTGADILLVSIDVADRSAAERGAWIAAHAHGRPARWHALGGVRATACGVADDVFSSAGEPIDCARGVIDASRLALLDGSGALRGIYGSTGESLDEAFERSLRVLDEAHARR